MVFLDTFFCFFLPITLLVVHYCGRRSTCLICCVENRTNSIEIMNTQVHTHNTKTAWDYPIQKGFMGWHNPNPSPVKPLENIWRTDPFSLSLNMFPTRECVDNMSAASHGDFEFDEITEWIEKDKHSKCGPIFRENTKTKAQKPLSRPPGLETPPQTPHVTYKLYEGDKCYLCQRKLLPNIEDIVILRCHSSCGRKLHYECLTNSPWVLKKNEIVCPTCSRPPDPEIMEHDRKSSSYLDFEEGLSLHSILEKIRFILSKCYVGKGPRRRGTDTCKYLFERSVLMNVRKNLGVSEENDISFGVDEKNLLIQKELDKLFGVDDTESKKMKCKQSWIMQAKDAAQSFVLGTSLDNLNHLGIDLRCIARYFTDTIKGILRLGFNMNYLKNTQGTPKLDMLIHCFGISYREIRSIHKEFFSIDTLIDRKTKFDEKHKFRCVLSSDTMRSIGLFTHDLYVLGMKKEDIHRFGFMQTEWYKTLNFKEIHIKLMRIKTESDFNPPNGPLYKASWDIDTMRENLNLEGILTTIPSRSGEQPRRTILSPVPRRPIDISLFDTAHGYKINSPTKKNRRPSPPWKKNHHCNNRRYNNREDRRYPRMRKRGN